MPVNPVLASYRRLLDRYGPQGWWPTTPPGGLRPRYHLDGGPRRLTPAEQWEIMVGAILTQSTTWRNAEEALVALSSRGALGLHSLAGLAQEDLAGLIRPSLYYNQKARNLKELARHVVDSGTGDLAGLLALPPQALRTQLLARRGIGPETADSILLYAAGYPFFVVDAFTRRICARLGWVEDGVSYERLQRHFTERLPADPALYNEYHALLVRHAVDHCRATPVCEGCCLRRSCGYVRGAAAPPRARAAQAAGRRP